MTHFVGLINAVIFIHHIYDLYNVGFPDAKKYYTGLFYCKLKGQIIIILFKKSYLICNFDQDSCKNMGRLD